MFERFTDRSRKVMALANSAATELNHEYIGTEHILLGLIREGAGVGASVLKNLGLTGPQIKREVDHIVKKGPEQVMPNAKLPATPRARKVVEYAIDESKRFDHNYVGTEHLLMGLIREDGGVASQLLQRLGVNLDGVKDEVHALLGVGRYKQLGPPTLHIFRGLPGSGKTTRANEIGCLVLSPRDMYSMVAGKYEYVARVGRKEPAPGRKKIKAWAQSLAYQTLVIGADVAVAETLLTLDRVQEWVDLADSCGATYAVHDCPCTVEESIERNTHDVPADVIQWMADKYEPWSY